MEEDDYEPQPMPDHPVDPRQPSPTVMDRYDTDTLNYLERSVKDDIKEDLKDRINKAKLTPDCRNGFLLLVDAITSFEFVVTSYKDNEELRKRVFELRECIAWMKVSTREVNLYSGEFTYYMSLLERHFTNKITRARAGFTTESQITSNLNTRHTQTNRNQPPEQKSGVNRIIGGLQ